MVYAVVVALTWWLACRGFQATLPSTLSRGAHTNIRAMSGTHMIALDHLLKPQEKPMDVDDATKGLASVQVSSPRPETGG